jgi:vacuolar-type H+-ATPase subunit C/Vma6
MDRQSMVDQLIADYESKIKNGLDQGYAENLYNILMNGIGYDKQTLREIIDEYNSRTWEQE